MGDRATVIFFDRVKVSPVVYLHWHGSRVPDWIDELRYQIADRKWDATYAAARFVGICHNHVPGNLSLGISSCNLQLPDLNRPSKLGQLSPGNAGLVIVNAGDFTWRAYAGYLAMRGGV